MSFKSGWEKLKQGTRETFGAEKSSLPDDVEDMVRRAEGMKKNYDTLISKAETVVQPDSTKKLIESVSKDKEKTAFRQPIYTLGQAIADVGLLDNDKDATVCGETIKSLAEVKSTLDNEIHEKFISPKVNLKEDLKEALKTYSDLKDKRLEYDAKKHKVDTGKAEKAGKYEEELRVAQQRLDDAISNARATLGPATDRTETSQAEHAQLMALMHSLLEYHRQAYETLKILDDKMHFADNMAAYQYCPRKRTSVEAQSPARSSSSLSRPVINNMTQRATALYDFNGTEADDLSFTTGDVMDIEDSSDPGWWRGRINGRSGMFPSNYVELMQ